MPFVTVGATGPFDGTNFGPNTPGTTTAGIQEAINSLPASGGIVFITASAYTTSSTIAITTQNVSLIGAGSGGATGSNQGATYIKLANSSNVDMVYVHGTGTTVVQGTRISGIFFDGNKANQTAGSILNLRSYRGYYHDLVLNNAYLTGVILGGSTNGATENMLSQIWVSTPGTYGIDIQTQATDNHFEQIVVNGAGATAGVRCTVASQRFSNMHIYGAGTLTYGFQLDGATQITITGCDIENIAQNNIYILSTNANATDITITACEIRDGSQTTNNTYDLVYLANPGSNQILRVTIAACNFKNSKTKKARYNCNFADSGVQFCSFIGNTSLNPQTANMNNSGTACTMVGATARIRLTSDTTSTSATYATTGLSFGTYLRTNYHFKAHITIIVNASASANFQIKALASGASLTDVRAKAFQAGGTTVGGFNAQIATGTALFASNLGVATFVVEIEGTVVVGANTTTIEIDFADPLAAGSAVVKAGSELDVDEFA